MLEVALEQRSDCEDLIYPESFLWGIERYCDDASCGSIVFSVGTASIMPRQREYIPEWPEHAPRPDAWGMRLQESKIPLSPA